MLVNLQKLGALAESARIGRGAHLEYTPDRIHRMVLAVELTSWACRQLRPFPLSAVTGIPSLSAMADEYMQEDIAEATEARGKSRKAAA
jgi:hypothetical protein